MRPLDWSHFDYKLGMMDYEIDYGLDMIVEFDILFSFMISINKLMINVGLAL